MCMVRQLAASLVLLRACVMGTTASYSALCNPISTDIYIIAYELVNTSNIQ